MHTEPYWVCAAHLNTIFVNSLTKLLIWPTLIFYVAFLNAPLIHFLRSGVLTWSHTNTYELNSKSWSEWAINFFLSNFHFCPQRKKISAVGQSPTVGWAPVLLPSLPYIVFLQKPKTPLLSLLLLLMPWATAIWLPCDWHCSSCCWPLNNQRQHRLFRSLP